MPAPPSPVSGLVPEAPASAAGLAELPRAVAAALWRGDQLGRSAVDTVSSGFDALDAVLPGGGWPCQGLTEVLSAQAGTLEWRLLGPLLGRVGAAGRSVVLVGPPRPPHPPGLRFAGLSERHLVWVMADTPAERLWATEQLVKANACGALITWLPQVRADQVRRLQVLAAGCAAPVFLCRSAAAASESSAAPLRLLARTGTDWELLVDVFKRKGPPLETTLRLPSVPGGLQAILTPRLHRPSTLLPRDPVRVPEPVPASTAVPEADHALVRAAADAPRRQPLAH